MTAYKRRGRGPAQKTLALTAAIVDILKEIQPASVRAVCYRLFVAGHIANMSKGQTDKVSRVLVAAREAGRVPWAWVVDENRSAERVNMWDNPEQILRTTVKRYRKDYWQDQPRIVEVWSEKGTVRGTLAPVLDEYGITLRVFHGFSSATALHDAALEQAGSKKPTTILYVGDYDPSGMSMSDRDIPGRLERYDGTAELVRLAIRREQTAEHDLPGFPAATKSGDTRHAWFVENYGNTCWELDALPPPVLREIVECAIFGLLDHDQWERARMVEAAEIESMKGFFAGWMAQREQIQAGTEILGATP